MRKPKENVGFRAKPEGGISRIIRKPKENIGFRDKPKGQDKQKYKKTKGKQRV